MNLNFLFSLGKFGLQWTSLPVALQSEFEKGVIAKLPLMNPYQVTKTLSGLAEKTIRYIWSE